MVPQQLADPGSSPSSSPPDKNPLQVAWEKFQSQAPAFTRLSIYFLAGTWILNWFLPPLVLDCTWVFLQRRWEIYRLITSVFVNPDLFPNLLAGATLLQLQRLEVASGSATMVWWSVVVFTIATNAIFTAIQAMLLAFHPPAAVWTSAGMWNVALGLMALEAYRTAPSQPTRTVCFSLWKVPTLGYPLLYLVFISIFAGRTSSMLAMAISTALGYAIGRDGSLCAMPLAVKIAIDRYGRGVTSGWIEQGSGCFASPLGAEGESLLPTTTTSSSSQHDNAIPTPSASSGQALGGASFRNADTRAARLQALERTSHS